jgi:hypothetical protein
VNLWTFRSTTASANPDGGAPNGARLRWVEHYTEIKLPIVLARRRSLALKLGHSLPIDGSGAAMHYLLPLAGCASLAAAHGFLKQYIVDGIT